jgi:hypothetical protein
MALAVSGKINDFNCDSLPDIVATIADVQSDTDRFERKAHHADCLVVELFAVKERPNRHAHLPPRDYPRARRRLSDIRLFGSRKSPGGPGLRDFTRGQYDT